MIPQIGQVWDYVTELRAKNRHLANDPLRITRTVEAGWMGVRLRPEPWESEGHEWLLYWKQIEDGCYVRRPALEGALREECAKSETERISE